MGSSQFDNWLASELDHEMQELAWNDFQAEQTRDDDAAMLADPAYHAWVDEQAKQFAAVVHGEAA